MKNLILTMGLLGFFPMAVFASARLVTPFDEGWEFCNVRVGQTAVDANRELGTTWESQFTTEHTEKSAELRALDRPEDWERVCRTVKDAPWAPATLPHAPVIEPRVITEPLEVVTYYRKSFVPPAAAKGRRLTLEFDGAMQICDVWLNGRHVAFRAGGYIGFSIDLTDKVAFDRPNELVVRLDNREHPLVPPGKPQKHLDFSYHSGLYRPARLIVTDAAHVDGVFATYPEVTDARAVVNVRVDVRNDGDAEVEVPVAAEIAKAKSLTGAERLRFLATGDATRLGELLAQAKNPDFPAPALATAAKAVCVAPHGSAQVTLSLTLENPALWSPYDPNLHRLRVTAGDDAKATLIGIRTFEADPKKGLRINGRHFHFQGANRHMEYPWIGNALSDEANWRDAVLLKRWGFDFVRLAHYPQSPAMLDACDALGLLVADPVAGWQFFNRNETFISLALRDVRELIRRDRNHPCVMLWETSLNEAYPPIEFMRRQAAVAHEEYPGCLTSGDSYSLPANLEEPVWDVPHTSWRQEGEKIFRPNDAQPQTASYHREYGDYEFGGSHSTTRRHMDSGQTGLLENAWNFYWETNFLGDDDPWSIGQSIWTGFDHTRGCEPNVSGCGVFDILRRPKFSAWFFRSQRDAELGGDYAAIADFRSEVGTTGTVRVVVFSNAEEVELYKDGQSLGRRKPDSGPDTPHVQFAKAKLIRWDGGNCRHLRHPAFTYGEVPAGPGTLRVVAYRGGVPVAFDTAPQYAAAAKLSVWVDDQGVPPAPGGNDPFFLRADVLDAQGRVVRGDNATDITFAVNDPYEIVSPATVKAEAGTASVLIRRKAGTPAVPLAATATAKELAAATRAFDFAARRTADAWHAKPFPTIREYDANHLYQIALPLGGIGTGSFSLGGRGELRDWEIMNVPAKRFSPGSGRDRQTSPFFAFTSKGLTSGTRTTSMLEGPLYDWERLDEEGRPAEHHGFPRFSNATFSGSFPAGTVHLRDSALPVEVDVTGFNPFVPGDAEGSGLPVGTLTYAVKNVSTEPLEVSVAGLMRNFIGRGEAKDNFNAFRAEGNLSGIFFQPGSAIATNSENWGSMALVTEERAGVSYRTSGTGNAWCWTILDWWDDFSDDGAFTDRPPCGDRDPLATLAVKKTIAPGATESFTFHLVWHFPNRRGWSNRIEGNWYATKYADAWDAAERIVPQLPALEEKSRRFTGAMAKSDFPAPIKEAALFNLAVFKSQTVFRLPSGHLMGWEGVKDNHGSCHGSCTHVWNYEQATAFLFPDLARTMRDVELNYALMDDGFMNFRANLPLDTAAAKRHGAAADGQMGCIMKAYREWLLSGDRDWLKANWPRVKLALSFCWTKDGWDADRDGVMEGSQHNTMDVNYSGPNPQMGFWYLGALRAAEEMAKDAGDGEFAAECRRLYESGSKWMDEHLFNGEYYEHLIYDWQTRKPYPDGVEPCAFQLGKGCLVDQLVGQQFAHLLGLGWLGNEKNERAATEAILKYNWLPDFTRHFNNMRSYAIGKECGLLMASWPRGRLRRPFPYFGEVMTGFEYVAAVEMIYEGRDEDAVRVIKAIRDRHDGARRNPYSEPECGHNYARSMASWGAINAWTGMRYSAPKGTLEFSPKHEGTFLWSVGKEWGLVTIQNGKTTIERL